MTNDASLPVTDSQSENSPVEKKTTRKKIWIILGITIGILACCCVVGAAVFLNASYKVAVEKYPIQQVLESYMFAMKIQNADRAYELLSPRAQRQFSLQKVQESFEGNNHVLYDGYESITIVTLKINAAFNTNPDMPQGTVAEVSGTISYQDDSQGAFKGILEKENDKWRIYGINVTVPPSKFK